MRNLSTAALQPLTIPVLLITLAGATVCAATASAAQGSTRGANAPLRGKDVGVSLAQGPNVLVILGDDFNWTDFDSVPTPNLDQLATQGMTFARAYAMPVCSPTRAALLFGRYPRRDGIGDIVTLEPPGPDNPTPSLDLFSLPECLRAHPDGDYRSAIFGKWHLGSNVFYDGDPAPDFGPYDWGAITPRLHGFDSWYGSMGNLRDYSSWTSVVNGAYVPSTEYAERFVLDKFLSWWHTPRGPKFAYVAFHNAHANYHAPPPDLLPPGYPTPVGARQEFEAMIVSLDLMIGRMLAEVDLTNTYVFFLSDNGSPLGVSIDDCPPRPSEPFTPFECGKHTVFEPGVRVPMIVAGPDVVPGSESQALVSCVDLMATVCELVGVPSLGEDSVSFRPSLLDPTFSARRMLFTEIFGEFPLFIGGNAMKFESAAIGQRYKLRRINGVETLYDLALDPREAAPISVNDPAFASQVAELRAVLDDPLERSLQTR